jgi:hypothetical protein
MKYDEIRKINVGEYVEKKNGLSYLSWAWAVDQLLLHDPAATWDYRWHDGVPLVKIGETAMVFCTVIAFGVARTAQLPVMDHRNKPIPNPDSFAVNTAMQRCLAKAIALHGIGLYIYNGEDLPPDTKPEDTVPQERRDHLAAQIATADSDVALRKLFKSLDEAERAAMMDAFTARAAELKQAA